MSEQQTTETINAECPHCGKLTLCDILSRHDERWDDGDVWGGVDHTLLRCCGCRAVYYRSATWNSENTDQYEDPRTGETETHTNYKIAVFPAPEVPDARPDWVWELPQIDTTLAKIVDELYTAADAKMFILASVGLRTALDRVTQLLGIDENAAFAVKLQGLQDGGWIGANERAALNAVAQAGHAATHRGWLPTEAMFLPLLRTLEQFMHRTLKQDKQALAVGAKIPPRPKRTPTVKPSQVAPPA